MINLIKWWMNKILKLINNQNRKLKPFLKPRHKWDVLGKRHSFQKRKGQT